MAGTVTPAVNHSRRTIQSITWDWTSSAGGVADGVDTITLSGEIMRVVFAPASPTPSDMYGVEILDEDGVDVLGGAGAGRSATVSQQIVPVIEIVVGDNTYASRVIIDGPLTLEVSDAGSAKKGTVTMYFR